MFPSIRVGFSTVRLAPGVRGARSRADWQVSLLIVFAGFVLSVGGCYVAPWASVLLSFVSFVMGIFIAALSCGSLLYPLPLGETFRVPFPIHFVFSITVELFCYSF
jgi:hypothetical protein